MIEFYNTYNDEVVVSDLCKMRIKKAMSYE